MRLKKVWRFVSGVVLTAVLLSGCGGGSASASANASVADIIRQHTEEENAETEVEAEDETESGAETEAGESSAIQTETHFSFSFELDGRNYRLPFDATRFQEEGLFNDFTIQGNLDNDLEPDTMQILFISEDEDKAEEDLTIFIYNGTEETKKVIDCQVSGISVSVADLEHHSFALSNGLKPGDDFATVCQVMGEPDFYSEEDNYDCAFYNYYDGDGEVRFYFHKDDPSWSSIDMTLNVKQ